jgi:vacuolar-type H+-ATPase subunit I/STV1
METYFKSDPQRVNMYLEEITELEKKLHVQTAEIPKLEDLLCEVKTQVSTIVGIENGSINNYFKQQLSIQHNDVMHLNKELELQQKRLEADKLNNINYDVKSLSSQDILRDKVNELEKKFAALKYNLMNSLSSDSKIINQ